MILALLKIGKPCRNEFLASKMIKRERLQCLSKNLLSTATTEGSKFDLDHSTTASLADAKQKASARLEPRVNSTH